MEGLRSVFNVFKASEPFREPGTSRKRAEDDSRGDDASEPIHNKKKKKTREHKEQLAEEYSNTALSLGLSDSPEIPKASKKKKGKRRKQHDGEVETPIHAVTPARLTMTAPTNTSMNDETLTQLNDNNDILRAFQGLDLPRLAGVLRNLDLPSADVHLNTTDSPFAALLASIEPHDDLLENPVSVAPPQAISASIENPATKAGHARKSTSRRPSQPSKSSNPNPNLAAIGPSIASEEHTRLLATKWLTSKKLQELQQSEGLVWKEGKFSAIEAHALKTCLDNYRMSHSLTHDELVNVIFSRKKEAHASFWSEIATCVPARPILAVYHYVQRKYHPCNRQGKWQADEDGLLIQAVADLGQAWKKVAERVGRTANDCRDRWRNKLSVRDTMVFGEWTKEEEEELTKIVMEFKKKTGNDTNNDICWGDVSRRMGNKRSRQQCRLKWVDRLGMTVKNDGPVARWSKVDASILVLKVAALNVRDDSEINWKRLPDKEWNLHSPHIMQRRWRTLVSAIKDHDQMPFQEVVEVLLQKYGNARYMATKPQKKHAHGTKQYKSAEVIEEEDAACNAEFTAGEDDRPHHIADSSAQNDIDDQLESEDDSDAST